MLAQGNIQMMGREGLAKARQTTGREGTEKGLTEGLVWCCGRLDGAALATFVVGGLRDRTPRSAQRAYLTHMKCHTACTQHKQKSWQLGMIANKLKLDSTVL